MSFLNGRKLISVDAVSSLKEYLSVCHPDKQDTEKTTEIPEVWSVKN